MRGWNNSFFQLFICARNHSILMKIGTLYDLLIIKMLIYLIPSSLANDRLKFSLWNLRIEVQLDFLGVNNNGYYDFMYFNITKFYKMSLIHDLWSKFQFGSSQTIYAHQQLQIFSIRNINTNPLQTLRLKRILMLPFKHSIRSINSYSKKSMA